MSLGHFNEVARRHLPAAYGLRPRTESDLAFLCALYAHTREEELAPVPWPESQKQAFLADQFDKQHRHYLQYYPQAQWWIVTCEGASVGRLYLDQTASDLRLMDVSLLATHRNQGVGTALMRAVLEQADRHGIQATLHVESFNPALRLYQRFGFTEVETRGVYLFMRREPSVEDDLVTGVEGVPADGNDEQVQGAMAGVQ